MLKKILNFVLSLHYDGANSYLFVNDTEIIKEWSKERSLDNMKNTGLNGYVYDFNVGYDATGVCDLLDIQKYLMKKNEIV